AEDYVPGLLAAKITTGSAHLLDDIAVANRSAVQANTPSRQTPFKTKVGHDRRDDRVPGQPSAAGEADCDQRHQLVAIENDTPLAGNDQPIGISIKGDAEIGTPRQDFLAHLLRRQRTTVAVDVEPVRGDRDREHLGAKLPEHPRRHSVARAVRAIDYDAQSVE